MDKQQLIALLTKMMAFLDSEQKVLIEVVSLPKKLHPLWDEVRPVVFGERSRVEMRPGGANEITLAGASDVGKPRLIYTWE